MWITAKGIGPNTKISGVPIKPGKHRYPLDSTDPLTALQLATLRDMGLIGFKETIDTDLVKRTEDALNLGTLRANVETRQDEKGNLIKEYKNSEIPEKANDKPVRPAAKPAKKSRKNDDRD